MLPVQQRKDGLRKVLRFNGYHLHFSLIAPGAIALLGRAPSDR